MGIVEKLRAFDCDPAAKKLMAEAALELARLAAIVDRKAERRAVRDEREHWRKIIELEPECDPRLEIAQKILREEAAKHGVGVEEFVSSSRHGIHYIAIGRIYETTRLPRTAIGALVRRDPSTVRKAIRSWERRTRLKKAFDQGEGQTHAAE
jgi:hypothetical protein